MVLMSWLKLSWNVSGSIVDALGSSIFWVKLHEINSFLIFCFIENEISHGNDEKQTWLACQRCFLKMIR